MDGQSPSKKMKTESGNLNLFIIGDFNRFKFSFVK